MGGKKKQRREGGSLFFFSRRGVAAAGDSFLSAPTGGIAHAGYLAPWERWSRRRAAEIGFHGRLTAGFVPGGGPWARRSARARGDLGKGHLFFGVSSLFESTDSPPLFVFWFGTVTAPIRNRGVGGAAMCVCVRVCTCMCDWLRSVPSVTRLLLLQGGRARASERLPPGLPILSPSPHRSAAATGRAAPSPEAVKGVCFTKIMRAKIERKRERDRAAVVVADVAVVVVLGGGVKTKKKGGGGECPLTARGGGQKRRGGGGRSPGWCERGSIKTHRGLP